MSIPKVSIITVCYQAGQVLEETILSAISQDFDDKEIVIVDGGSKDNTFEIIEKYRNKISVFVSEPDKGIYDAMNKAIRLAHGEWVYFLNAGDRFYSKQVLSRVFNKNTDEISLIYAKVQTINEPTGVNYLNGKKVTYTDFYSHYPICHQATFTRRKAFEKYQYYQTQYKLVADTTWFAGFFKRFEIETRFEDEIIAFYDIQGASYHKRMQGYREYIHYGFKEFPVYIAIKNLLFYPLIWLKVKGIRVFQNQAWFVAYRKWKMSKNRIN